MRHYSIKQLRFSGYRKFGAKTQAVDFAYPDLVNPGSGLNIIVGTISSGKTSLLEMIGWACGLGLPDLDRMVINDLLPSGTLPNVSAEWIAPAFEQDPEVTYEVRSEFGMSSEHFQMIRQVRVTQMRANS
jgi:AAA15 family ATPase/GTPase